MLFSRHITTIVAATLLLFCAGLGVRADETGRVRVTASRFKDSSLQATDYYLRGIKAVEEGDGRTALALFGAALGSDSLHAPSSYRISTILADNDEALRYARRAWEIDSTNVWYAAQVGGLLTKAGRYREALEAWRACRRIDPDDIQTYKYIAALLDAVGQPLSAIATIDTALTRFTDDLDLLEYKGELLSTVYRPREVIANAQRMVALDPENGRYMAILAKAHAGNGSDTLASMCFKRAVEQDSSDIEVLVEAAMFYENTGNVADYLDILNLLFASEEIALADKVAYFESLMGNIPLYRKHVYVIERMLNTLRLYHPDSYEVDRLYARHLIYTGGQDKALEIFKRRSTDTVDSIAVDALVSVVSIEAMRNEPDSVEHYLSYALGRFPDNYDLPMLRASLLYERGEYSEAVASLRKRLRKTDNDSISSVYYGFIGDIEQRAGRIRQCYKAYDKALAFDEDNINVLNNYSYFLSVEGRDLDRALVMASRVLEAEPSNPTYIDTYGWVLYRLGRYKEARTYLLKAIALDETPSAEVLMHYGDVMYRLGEKSNAVIYWQKALRAGGDREALDRRIRDGL